MFDTIINCTPSKLYIKLIVYVCRERQQSISRGLRASQNPVPPTLLLYLAFPVICVLIITRFTRTKPYLGLWTCTGWQCPALTCLFGVRSIAPFLNFPWARYLRMITCPLTYCMADSTYVFCGVFFLYGVRQCDKLSCSSVCFCQITNGKCGLHKVHEMLVIIYLSFS